VNEAPAVGLGIHIRAARQQAGLTQGELAELVGVQPSCVSQWERGVFEPSLHSFLVLVRLFGGRAFGLPEAGPLQQCDG
jgi:DNA-binding XRE family transcriptional regulator